MSETDAARLLRELGWSYDRHGWRGGRRAVAWVRGAAGMWRLLSNPPVPSHLAVGVVGTARYSAGPGWGNHRRYLPYPPKP